MKNLKNIFFLSFIYLLTLCGKCGTQDTLPTNIIVSNSNELHLVKAKSLPDNIISLLDEVNDILDVDPNIVRLDVTNSDKQIAHLIGKKFLRPESFNKDEAEKLDLTEWATQVADNQQSANATINEYIKTARTNTEDSICVFVLSETLQTGQCNFNGEAVTVYNIKNEKAALLKEVKTLIEKNEKKDETQRRNIQLYLVYNPVCGEVLEQAANPTQLPIALSSNTGQNKGHYVKETVKKFYDYLNEAGKGNGSATFRNELDSLFSPNTTIEESMLNGGKKTYNATEYIDKMLAMARNRKEYSFAYEAKSEPTFSQRGEFKNGYKFTITQKLVSNSYCDDTDKTFEGTLVPESTGTNVRWKVKIDKIIAHQANPCK